MFKSYFKLFPLLTAVICTLMAGCGKMAQVTEPIVQGKGVAMLKIVAAAGGPFQKLAKRATLTITAADILTMTKNLTITDSSVEGTISGIPAGKNRLFAVAVYDSLDTLQYRGSSTANVIADSVVKVSINVTRVSGTAIIDGNIIETPAQMKYLPGGTFQMGEIGISEPVHTATISAFYIDTIPVTQADYVSIMSVNPSIFTGNLQRPVENLTWYDAVLYCNKRSKRDGKDTVYSYTAITGTAGNGCTGLTGITINYAKKGYRLPTEAEFEFACRGGTTTAYWWGADTNGMGARAWTYYNSDSVTHPVATKLPNPFGLYDMTGNVWKWCNDWYGAYSAGAVTNPTGAASGPGKVLRGGSCAHDQVAYFAAYRDNKCPPNLRFNNVGFRCVCGL